MAMRSQVYAWNNGSASHGGLSGNTVAGTTYSIFIGGLGNNITKPAETTATQFVVIEDIGCDSTSYDNTADGYTGGRSYVQVVINTTSYFLDPDNVGNDGVPGTAAPYPRTIAFQPSFNLYPDVYVLPGQTWDVQYKSYTIVANGSAEAFVKYTLYDGPDALIANKLLEMGISVNPGNVDWYKRTLISGASAPAPQA
jgi:hypothetical protein